MSGFYEWDANKQKLFFTNPGNNVIYVGGFYRIHKKDVGFETESILMTTSPNESVAPIHDRMPLIVEKDHIKEWLTDLDFARKYLTADMPALQRVQA